jgi:hypothetical protein
VEHMAQLYMEIYFEVKLNIGQDVRRAKLRLCGRSMVIVALRSRVRAGTLFCLALGIEGHIRRHPVALARYRCPPRLTRVSC